MTALRTACCIVGGGPAGMMLGFLLARAGVDVTVLEKHPDFFRDFRGDTIHPSTLEMLSEIGLLDEFLKRPHDELERLSGQIGSDVVTIGDFSHLPTKCKFLAFMPQWDFLDFLREQAAVYPTFHLLMQTSFDALVHTDGRVTGIRAKTESGETLEIAADLVVGADGRHSAVRQQAGLEIEQFGAPMDVLWMRIPMEGAHVAQTLGYVGNGHVLVLINRNEYWQAGLVIPKGSFEELRTQPIDRLRDTMTDLAPFLASHVHAITSWDDVHFLQVRVDRLRAWAKPGVLCIGDAAHAMSPIGGVGINLAVQDAVATANLLWRPLREGKLQLRDLQAVQKRREFPTVMTQGLQRLIQAMIVRRVLRASKITRAPWILRMLTKTRLPRLAARTIGVGFRPERVQTPLLK